MYNYFEYAKVRNIVYVNMITPCQNRDTFDTAKGIVYRLKMWRMCVIR